MKNETTPMTLSSEAQSVLVAYYTEVDRLAREVSYEEMLAAALRAVADQVVPDDGVASSIEKIVEKRIRSRLFAIAAELETL